MNNPEFNTELKEWIEALENTILSDGKEYSKELLKALFTEASLKGIVLDELNDPSFKNRTIDGIKIIQSILIYYKLCKDILDYGENLFFIL